MQIDYFISSPDGDVVLDSALRHHPLILGPAEFHRSLTLGDLFQTIGAYLVRAGEDLLGGVSGCSHQGQNVLPGERQCIVRMEKQGQFYFVFSVENRSPGLDCRRLALLCALSAEGHEVLTRDHANLIALQHRQPMPFLPQPLRFDTFNCIKDNTTHEFLLSIQPWFDDYWEWHADSPAGDQIQLWDYQRGHRRLILNERDALFRQAAAILTATFDQDALSSIYPWHHGAGDFILRAGDGGVDVKLTTVRGYGATGSTAAADDTALPAALLHLFFRTALKMRLDKVDGVGATVWFPRHVLPSLLLGLADGLTWQCRHGVLPSEAFALFSLVKGCTRQELRLLHEPVLEDLDRENQGDLLVITSKLDSHIQELQDAAAAVW